MPRRGRSAAFLKSLRRKHKLGEFASKTKRVRSRLKKAVKKASKRVRFSRKHAFSLFHKYQGVTWPGQKL